jgi:hypothetical protein
MTVLAPDQDAFLTRFPEFADYDGDIVDAALEEAARWVDDSWLDGDFQIAIMLLAAHILFVGGGDSIAGSTTLKIGPFTESFKAGGDKWADASSYGQRFIQLRRVNHPQIMVI